MTQGVISTSQRAALARSASDAAVVRSLDDRIVAEWLRYAELVSRRGYVTSQLGNIALRVAHEQEPVHGVVYTKHRGISLEEATREHLIVTDVERRRLLFGARSPSIGHQLNTEVFRCRPDVNAVIHLHVDEVLSYFTMTGARELRYISADTGLILGKPLCVLEPGLNVEVDASSVCEFIAGTNAFVMPNHGITTLGADISVAYNRMNVVVAEVRRLGSALLLSAALNRPVPYLSPDETELLHSLSAQIVGRE